MIILACASYAQCSSSPANLAHQAHSHLMFQHLLSQCAVSLVLCLFLHRQQWSPQLIPHLARCLSLSSPFCFEVFSLTCSLCGTSSAFSIKLRHFLFDTSSRLCSRSAYSAWGSTCSGDFRSSRSPSTPVCTSPAPSSSRFA